MQKRKPIYLDSNAGTPLHPHAIASLREWIDAYQRPTESGEFLGNPSSIHSHGRIAKQVLAEAREAVASSLGHNTDSGQVSFTSSGTESNQWVIRSVLEKAFQKTPTPHWITTSVEHDSVLQMQEWFLAKGGQLTLVPVDSKGVLVWDEAAFEEALRPETALISMIWVNNETGVISPIHLASRALKKSRREDVFLHIDGAQAWGKIPIDVQALKADSLALSGHKIGAASGVGVLWLKRGKQLEFFIRGKQERGRRGGTENILGILTLLAAAKAMDPKLSSQRLRPWITYLETAILTRIPEAEINGLGAPRVGNTLNVSFSNLRADSLVMALDLAGFSISSGSACSSGTLAASHVLLAMGRTQEEAKSSLRISLDPSFLTDRLDDAVRNDLDLFLNSLEKTISRMREVATQSQTRKHYEYPSYGKQFSSDQATV